MDLVAGVVEEVEKVKVAMDTTPETIPKRGRGRLEGMVRVVDWSSGNPGGDVREFHKGLEASGLDLHFRYFPRMHTNPLANFRKEGREGLQRFSAEEPTPLFLVAGAGFEPATSS